MKILVIEDETILRTEVIEWLTFEGYEAFGASDGIEGVESALKNLPDLIVSDIMMPRLDGYGVVLELRSNPATASIPVIFLTARAAYEDIRKGMSLGADDYITKPFTLDQLLQAVEVRLEKKRSQEATHLREIEGLQHALEHEHEQRMLKVKLIGMFSHDFRNPLAGILSSNSLLRDYADRMDAERRLMHLNRIDGLTRQLIQMLDDMLIVARMETGSFVYRPEEIKIGDFLFDMVEEFKAMHGETHQFVYVQRTDDLTKADPQLLRHMLSNVVGNAVKYSRMDSEIRVTLDKADGMFVIGVQDHGMGIPAEDQKHMFEAFKRGSNVISISGTGLGLAIVKQAVELHGGTISLQSQVGVGTTVTISLPA